MNNREKILQTSEPQAKEISPLEAEVMLRHLLYKIHNENCLDTLAKLPSECIDLIVTSPPYDDMRTYKGYTFEFEKIAVELSRVLKCGGVLVWVVNDQTINGSETLTSCKQKIYFRENCGLNIHDTMIYEKNNFSNPSNNRYHQIFEYIFILSKGSPKTFNPIKDKPILWGDSWGKNTNRQVDGSLKETNKRKNRTGEMGMRTNIWKYNVGGLGMSSVDQEAHEHPAIFPEDLAKDHILSWSNEGDIVYDPFSGSGTTCKVADRLGRVWLGSEIAEEYCSVALRRISKDLFTKAAT